MFLSQVPWDRSVVTKEDEKITNYSPQAKEDASGVDEDFAIGGWLFGCGDLGRKACLHSLWDHPKPPEDT